MGILQKNRQYGGMAENFGLIALAVGLVAFGAIYMSRKQTMPVVSAVGQVIEKGMPPAFDGPDRLEAVNGEAYQQALTAHDNAGVPVKVTLEKSELPAGLSFDESTATLSGTPEESGESVLKLSATDARGAIGTRNLTLAVMPAKPEFTTPLQSIGTLGQPFVLTLTAKSRQPGDMRYHGYAITAGALPAGVRIDRDRHRLAGIPATTGTATIAVSVTDAAGAQTRADFSLSVPPLRATLSSETPDSARLVLPIPPSLKAADATLTLPEGLTCKGAKLVVGRDSDDAEPIAIVSNAAKDHSLPITFDFAPKPDQPAPSAIVIALQAAADSDCTVAVLFDMTEPKSAPPEKAETP